MTPLLKKAALASVLALSFGVTAHAAVDHSTYTDAGLVSENWSTTVATTTGTFSDLFTFSLVPNAGVGLSAQSVMVSSFGTSLSTIALYLGSFTSLGALTGAPIGAGVVETKTGMFSTTDNLYLDFSQLAANTAYTMVVSGDAVGRSSYTSIIQLAPVPEPETYAMLLAGLGVMGFVARRKSRKSTSGHSAA